MLSVIIRVLLKNKGGVIMSQGGRRPHPEALYYSIAQDALASAKNEKDKFKRKQLITSTLIFSALCFEVFINQEYAAHSETKKIDEDERLSLETKWLMLPLLLGSAKTFDKGTYPYQTFIDIIRTRNNRLVHFKPKKEIELSGQLLSQEYFGDLISNVELAIKYFQCIGDMIKELNKLTCGKTDIPNFLNGGRYTSTVWAELEYSWEIKN